MICLTFFVTDLLVSSSPEISCSPSTATNDARKLLLRKLIINLIECKIMLDDQKYRVN